MIGRFFLGKIFTPSLLKLFTKKELLLFLLEFSYESWDFIGSLKWYRALLKWEMAIFKPLLAFFFFFKGNSLSLSSNTQKWKHSLSGASALFPPVLGYLFIYADVYLLAPTGQKPVVPHIGDICLLPHFLGLRSPGSRFFSWSQIDKLQSIL